MSIDFLFAKLFAVYLGFIIGNTFAYLYFNYSKIAPFYLVFLPFPFSMILQNISDAEIEAAHNALYSSKDEFIKCYNEIFSADYAGKALVAEDYFEICRKIDLAAFKRGYFFAKNSK